MVSNLVSVLIPAHKPDFFEPALRSALAQTYRPIEIIVGDDSPSPDIRTICSGYPEVRYIKRAAPSLRENVQGLLEAASGYMIKFLCDDDLLHPSCVEKMYRVLDETSEVALVTSASRIIDKDDRVHQLRTIVEDKGLYLKGRDATLLSLTNTNNFFGELTTFAFRRNDFSPFAGNVIRFGEADVAGLADLVMAYNLCSIGDLVYLPTPLSSFRIHATSGTGARGERFCRSVAAWEILAEEARALGYFGDAEYRFAMRGIVALFRSLQGDHPPLRLRADAIAQRLRLED